MVVKLKKLIRDMLCHIVVKGSKEIDITGISNHSKKVYPGNLFIAKRGLSSDGSLYIPEAIANGAVAILTDLYDPFLPPHITQLVASDMTCAESELLKLYYHDPSAHMKLFAVTGTNGKTTSTYLIRHVLEGLGTKTGLISSIEYVAGSHHFPSTHSTPDLATNYKLFSEMQQAGCTAAVMEAASHGLDQERLFGLNVAVAVFTNLTVDHLDYHQTMDAYLAAKAKLFQNLAETSTAVVNADTDCLEPLLRGCPARLMTYGIERAADCRATDLKLAANKSYFQVEYRGEKISTSFPLIGKFNVYNYLAAVTALLSQGVDLKLITSLLSQFKNVPGRLERIAHPRGASVFVDYAHTGDGLKNVLETLAAVKKGRLITVFGSGGDRDPNRRFQMGEVADKLSDVSIITTDNARNEDPEKIAREIASVFKTTAPLVELDRRAAIKKSS